MNEATHRRETVLVIDDDSAVVQSFERVLTDNGYHVKTALNGQSGLDLLKESDFDLVFTDIKMPGMDGIEVASRIKSEHPDLPVVIATGYGSEANEQRAREVGVTKLVRKPLSPDFIQMITAEALVRKHDESVAAVETKVAAEPVALTVAEEQKVNVAKNIALFFAAPFIGLAYIVAFPFIGIGMLVAALTGKRQETKG